MHSLSAYNKCQDVQPTIVGGAGDMWLCRVQVNSGQVSYESFAEAGERLCGRSAGSSFHRRSPRTGKSWDSAGQPLLDLSDGVRS